MYSQNQYITMANAPPPGSFHPVSLDPAQYVAALRNVDIQVVGEERPEKAYLMEDSTNPSQCYQRWPNKRPQSLGEKGKLVYCQVLQRHRSGPNIMFQRSDKSVAIKKLKRRVIDPPIEEELRGEGPVVNENPYNEIAVMQQYGHNDHMMKCYEALRDEQLRDERYLYIVTLEAREGDLESHLIPNEQNDPIPYEPRNQIPTVMTKLVHNLKYMEQHRLVHRDLKPKNCVVEERRFIFIDFAMTVKSAIAEGNVQDILPRGQAGTWTYMSPEVYLNESFNKKVDTWALGCILWKILTGLELYDFPTVLNPSYRFFIVKGGLRNKRLCEVKLEERANSNPSDIMVPRLQAVQKLPSEARDLLAKLLKPMAGERPSLEEVLQHPLFRPQMLRHPFFQ